MVEYGGKQRNQLSRAIANSETGSRQLKGFADNRKPILKNSYNAILQRTKWKWNFAEKKWKYESSTSSSVIEPTFQPNETFDGRIYDDVSRTWSAPIAQASSIPDNETIGGYTDVGKYQGKKVYAKLSIEADPIYKTAMEKGVISSGSTGEDGIKFETDKWAIKITIAQASSKEGLDNTWSPCTTGPGIHKKHSQTGEDIIKLDFNSFYKRH